MATDRRRSPQCCVIEKMTTMAKERVFMFRPQTSVSLKGQPTSLIIPLPRQCLSCCLVLELYFLKLRSATHGRFSTHFFINKSVGETRAQSLSPRCSRYSGHATLQSLRLGGNQLTSAAGLGQMPKLEILEAWGKG